MSQVNRQGATQIGVIRRMKDAGLENVPDPRGRQGTRIPFVALLNAILLGCIAAIGSLRDVESLTASLTLAIRRLTGIKRRISDTKLRDTLIGLDMGEARRCLHNQVKAEHRRGNLMPTRLPFNVVAIDGKGLGKFDSWDHPNIQKVSPKNKVPYGLARVHRAHLVSSRAAVCVDQRPIPGSTNEVGAVCDFTAELLENYKHTTLIDVITADAGNGSLAHATLINKANRGYVLAIKENSGEIYREATRLLGEQNSNEPEDVAAEIEKGARVTRSIWRHSFSGGFLQWSHARQVVRVKRVVEKMGKIVEVGNRYFVTNLVPGRLNSEGWLTLVRMHWRCENDGHWTADVVWKEDAKRTPWIKDPGSAYTLSYLRMIGLNVLAVFRSFTRREWDNNLVPWKNVVEAVRFAIAVSTITFSRRFCLD